MHHMPSPLRSPEADTASPADGEELILADLRAFAREIGVPGASALNKEELIESLRQKAVLENLLRMDAQGRAAGVRVIGAR